nr:hypothetical protein [Tanacetum cinerariifolium]
MVCNFLTTVIEVFDYKKDRNRSRKELEKDNPYTSGFGEIKAVIPIVLSLSNLLGHGLIHSSPFLITLFFQSSIVRVYDLASMSCSYVLARPADIVFCLDMYDFGMQTTEAALELEDVTNKALELMRLADGHLQI